MRMKISDAGERDVAFKLGDVQNGCCFCSDGVICVKSNHFRYGCDARVKEYACLGCKDGHLMWINENSNVRVVGAELHVGLYE